MAARKKQDATGTASAAPVGESSAEQEMPGDGIEKTPIQMDVGADGVAGGQLEGDGTGQPLPEAAPALFAANATPIPPPEPKSRAPKYRIWKHGGLERNGTFYPPGAAIELSPEQAATIPCVELVGNEN